MLTRLPLELVQHIVQLCLPSTTSPLTYRHRQDTLLALCRTNKALNGVAQSLLYEVVEIRTSEVNRGFLDKAEKARLGQRVSALFLVGEGIGLDYDAADTRKGTSFLRELSAHLPNLLEIRIYQRRVDLADLAPFTITALTNITLPSLQELSLMCSVLHILEGVFTPASLPALSALHLQLQNPEDLDVDHLDLSPLVLQLDSFSCDYRDMLDVFSLQYLATYPCALIDFSTFRTNLLDAPQRNSLSTMHSARFNPYAGVSDLLEVNLNPEYSSDEVLGLATILAQGRAPQLSLLVLPLDFKSEHDQEEVARFLSFLADHQIEVVFESTPHPFYDSHVSAGHLTRRETARKTAEDQGGCAGD
ncbi:hypothetical protein JCM11641_001953 [Rhodosporidiobolus odoratus]